MSRDILVCGMPLRSFLIRAVPLILPGLLLLVGGRSAPTPPSVPGAVLPRTALIDLIANALYPDNVLALMACSVLICLPGAIFVLGADYLAEVVFWRFPLNTTPGIIWRVVGYLIAVAATVLALGRVLEAWKVLPA